MKSTPVREIMSKDVVTISSFAPFRRIAATMLTRGIGAVPVVDSVGHPIGLVSRTDLIAKEAASAGQSELWEFLTRRGREVQARGGATTADRLMTTELVTVTPDTGVARAAYLMERHAVTHLPVVDKSNVVVGIVSRSDLLRAYLRDGREIRREVEQALRTSLPDDDLETIKVHIEDGIITLSGTVDRRFAAHALHHLRAIRGVVDVVDDMQPREREVADDAPAGPGPLF